MVEARPHTVMILISTTEIKEVLQMMGTLLSFLGIKLMCWCRKKDCCWNTAHTTNLHGAYKQNPTIFCLPDTHSCIKSLHKSNETSSDMTPTYQTVSTVKLEIVLVPPTMCCALSILLRLMV